MICNNCVFAQNNYCRRLGATINTNIQDCLSFLPKDRLCELCNQPIPYHTGVYENDVLVCNNCGTHLGKCATCQHGNQCLINSYTGPKPKIINQTFPHPNNPQMIIQQQVINPELEQELCPQCACGSPSNCKEMRTCGNYKLKEK